MEAQSDKELSSEAIMVRDALIECGLETPWHDNGLSSSQKKDIIKKNMSEIMPMTSHLLQMPLDF